MPVLVYSLWNRQAPFTKSFHESMLLDGCQSGEVQPAVVIPFFEIVSLLLDGTEGRSAKAVQLQGHDGPILCSYLYTTCVWHILD